MSLKENACENCVFYEKTNARNGVCHGYAIHLKNVLTGKKTVTGIGQVRRYYYCDKHIRRK